MEGTNAAYLLSAKNLLTKLKTKATGLSDLEAKKRLEINGPNELTPPKPRSILSIYFSQFKNSLIIILLLATFLTIGVWYFTGEGADLIEAILILGIVILITAFGFFQEFKAERALEKIRSLLSLKAKVIRSGKRILIDSSQLVTGDIVIIEEGDKIPADGRLIENANLHTNEAVLTGESTPVKKDLGKMTGQKSLSEQLNMVFSGTEVAKGRATVVIAETGNATEVGKIAHLVATTEEGKTPIQKRLDEISRLIGFVVLIIAIGLFVFTYFVATDSSSTIQRIIEAAIAAVALGVAAVPEGLPAVVTIAMAFGTQKMLKRRVLVRKLNSVETLGSVDVICSDKTGTLTSGEMTVTKLWNLAGESSVSGVGYSLEGQIHDSDNSIIKETLLCGLVCNNATVEPEITGDPTEVALIVSARKGQVSSASKRVDEEPFSSERKRMSVLVKSAKQYQLFTKGAPEIVLERCTQIYDGQKTRKLTSNDKQKILTANSQMAAEALRVLAFATKTQNSSKIVEEELVFLGLQGMSDPARPEIKQTLNYCRESGVRVMMITGDNPETAKAIAKQIGLPERCLTGAELDKLSADEFDRLVAVTSLYARVSPDFKLRIVDSLKRQGHIVAMTGDGVNDAPALKKADIGVAMGKTGTDVAREASDMVLLDDNFSNIVEAIIEGRGIYHNIRKFVGYLISCNIAEVMIVVAGALIFKDVVLTAVMLLWINVVTDGLPAVAIGLDPAEKNVINRQPQEFQQEIVTRHDWKGMIGFSVIISAATLTIYYLTSPAGEVVARTAAFSALVIFELVRIFIIRLNYQLPVFSNPFLIFAVVLSLLLQLAVIYIPPLRQVFVLTSLSASQWYPILFASTVLLIIPIISKLTGRRTLVG